MQEEHNNSLLIGLKIEAFEIIDILGIGGFVVNYIVSITAGIVKFSEAIISR